MKLFIISFGSNSRIVAKFQTHRFRTFGENREEKNKETGNVIIPVANEGVRKLRAFH